jgi:F0F1-type ATP synthase assembly protein I
MGKKRDSKPGLDAAEQAGHMRALGLGTGWAVFSYLIAGMVAYGAIGWLVSRATHIAILFPLGMLLGLGISLGYVIFRYGRAEARAASGEGLNLRKGADR